MERWANKVAVVTRADLAIGAECCKQLIEHGMIVVALARHTERVENLRGSLMQNSNNLHCIQVISIYNKREVIGAFAEIERRFGAIFVFVHAIVAYHSATITSSEDVRGLSDANVLSVACCAREVFRSMKKHNVEGHVMLINSIKSTANSKARLSSTNAIQAMKTIYHCEFPEKCAMVKMTIFSPVDSNNDINSEYCATHTLTRLSSLNVAKSLIDTLQSCHNRKMISVNDALYT